MNLSKIKAMLAECHLQQTELKPFLEKAGPEYFLGRAIEELEKSEMEKDYEKLDLHLKEAIKFINIARYKKRIAHENNTINKQSTANPSG